MITKNPSVYVFGANTDLGKTIFSAGICLAAVEYNFTISYIKPVQTGFPQNSDVQFVENQVKSNILSAEHIFSFTENASPHRVKNSPAENDENMLLELKNKIENCTSQILLIEGAGGIASPSLNGNLQCDVYRRFRLPIVFIGDSKLGGISATISSIELALSRGFEISCLLLFEGEHENHIYFKNYYQNKFPVFSFPIENNLDVFYKKNKVHFNTILKHITHEHEKRIENFQNQKNDALKHFWWPFTQHKNLSEPQIIDSAYEDCFEIVHANNYGASHKQGNYEIEKVPANKMSQSVYDGSASWWTQCIGHANPALTQAASAAAGRYGHILYPGNIHEPALKLIEKLLQTVGQNWASRVFFSDNGSTAVEIAIKMAFRKSYGLKQNCKPLILGLKDSFHGETHGTMDATEPNSFKQHEHWYHPRGIWLEYPKVFCKNKLYFLRLPTSFHFNKNVNSAEKYIDVELPINSMEELFHYEKRSQSIVNCYFNYFQTQLNGLQQENIPIGACLLEGIVQGSGGMQLVDPLFQKLLIEECQKRKIPVILDEVFTGLWRLGEVSTSKMLQIKPDIACYGKVITGGLLPLGAVLAQEEIFECFLGENITTSLLHGHSYTANPISCSVASAAIEQIQMSQNFNLKTNSLFSFWNKEKIDNISCLNNISRIYALGTILALELLDDSPGYTSVRAKNVIVTLKQHQIDARPLGNVVYILAGFNSSKKVLEEILNILYVAVI